MTSEQINNWFTYHPPTPEQQAKYVRLRENAKEFAFTIEDCCPEGPDKSAAMRQLRECVMTANASIACAGVAYDSGGQRKADGEQSMHAG